jgi:GT2 family glycosyltransferase
MVKSVSVIISTKNRLKELINCLNSIRKLTYPFVEVIIVDSNNSPFLNEKIKKIARDFNAQYVLAPNLVLGAAQNIGISLSRGEIIAFTDDDCIVDENWLSNIVRHFTDASIVAVTGRTIGLKPCDFERIKGHDRGERGRLFNKFWFNPLTLLKSKRLSDCVIPWCIGNGNNMAFRKELFNIVGMFLNTCTGNDTEMFYRILHYPNMKIIYEPAAIVYHYQNHDLHRVAYKYSAGAAFNLRCYFLRDPWTILLYLGRLFQLIILSCVPSNRYDINRIELRGFINGTCGLMKQSIVSTKPSGGSEHA